MSATATEAHIHLFARSFTHSSASYIPIAVHIHIPPATMRTRTRSYPSPSKPSKPTVAGNAGSVRYLQILKKKTEKVRMVQKAAQRRQLRQTWRRTGVDASLKASRAALQLSTSALEESEAALKTSEAALEKSEAALKKSEAALKASEERATQLQQVVDELRPTACEARDMLGQSICDIEWLMAQNAEKEAELVVLRQIQQDYNAWMQSAWDAYALVDSDNAQAQPSPNAPSIATSSDKPSLPMPNEQCEAKVGDAAGCHLLTQPIGQDGIGCSADGYTDSWGEDNQLPTGFWEDVIQADDGAGQAQATEHQHPNTPGMAQQAHSDGFDWFPPPGQYGVTYRPLTNVPPSGPSPTKCRVPLLRDCDAFHLSTSRPPLATEPWTAFLRATDNVNATQL